MPESVPPEADDAAAEVTQLLRALRDGDDEVREALARAVYRHLHAIAARQMRQETPGHTLQTTVLVHEAFVRLVDQSRVDWHDRVQFYRLAARVMRRVLLDEARRRHAAKRGGGLRIALADTPPGALIAPEPDERVTALEEALGTLAAHDPRASQVVDLRWFGGLGVDETAQAMGISPATVKRDWRFAQAFLRRALGERGLEVAAARLADRASSGA
jgi:RNA polymerase sigma factor (TIGR02999 family)